MTTHPFKQTCIAFAVFTLLAPATGLAETETNSLNEVKVISTTPLEGIGLSIDKVPANVQVVKGKQLDEQGNLNIADFLNNNLQGVNVVETQGNPYQPDVYFHGFNASPLLGAPQGLSVYVDGVRVNEPFGDVVSWDLIPMNAIDQMQLVPGTNPVFGLNTLGGAISIKTKRGRTNQGGSFENTFGSWGRKVTEIEFGGISEKGLDYFVAVTSFNEKGWRDASPTSVSQYFGQLGWQDSKTDVNFTITVADNDMTGNGLLPSKMMSSLGRSAVFTKPDETKNQMLLLNLTVQHELSNESLISGNVYYRHVATKTLNGDLNDDVVEQADIDEINAFVEACRKGNLTGTENTVTIPTAIDELCNAAINTSNTRKNGLGGSLQWTSNSKFAGKDNQLITGINYNLSKIRFRQDTQFGTLTSDRGVDAVPYFGDSTSLDGTTNTWSLFASNTLSMTDRLHLTTSARYDHVAVSNKDLLVPSGTGSLTADHTFGRLNPSVGLNFNLSNNVATFVSYNEGSRAPTSMELGCADPAAPCKLPNSMAGDPPLKQVVTKSVDMGLRGAIGSGIGWSVSAYQAINHDDIHFVRNGTSGSAMGYFTNVGKTKRVGLDAGVFGSTDSLNWSANISSIRATYEDSFQAFVGNNKNKTKVAPGDHIPGIPALQFKMHAAYQVTPAWNVGTNVIYTGQSFLQGNENNDWYAFTNYFGTGKADAYTVVHLNSNYKIENSNWSVIGKVNNVFNTKYNTGGLQGSSMFSPTTNAYAGDDYRDSLFAPGAPRALWVGVKYEFDKPKNKN